MTLVTKIESMITADVTYLWILTPVSRCYFVAFGVKKKENRTFVKERPFTF